MDIQISGIQVTDALKTFIQEKMEKLNKFHQDITKIEIDMKVEHETQAAESTVFMKGFEAHAAAESTDMYATIDMLVDKLLTQIGKHKEKLMDKHHHRT
jgi:putative sigma-54 modulation protein